MHMRTSTLYSHLALQGEKKELPKCEFKELEKYLLVRLYTKRNSNTKENKIETQLFYLSLFCVTFCVGILVHE